MFNREKSWRLAKYAAEVLFPGYCWYNALTSLRSFPDWFDEGAKYVEGHAIPASAGMPRPHGWIQESNGDIVDPTWFDETEIEYFPGIIYSLDDLQGVDAESLPYVLDGKEGRNNRPYAESYIKASEAAFGTKLNTRLRKPQSTPKKP
jgi:hypothetical protein